MRVAGILVVAALVVVAAAAFLNGPSNPAPRLDPGSNAGQPAPAAEASSSSTSVPPVLRAAPALLHLDGWLQSDVASLDELRGHVVIVQFWTFGCHNCKATLSHLSDIYARYHDEGLEIVGVHAPEFEYERDPTAIQAAAEELGVVWPIALDTHRRDFRRWQGSPAYWPRTYVVDADGRIRFDHIGEGAYDELEQTVVALLAALPG